MTYYCLEVEWETGIVTILPTNHNTLHDAFDEASVLKGEHKDIKTISLVKMKKEVIVHV